MRYYPRLLELALLLVSLALTAVSLLAVHQAVYPDHSLAEDAIRIAVPMGAFFVAHWVLSYTRPRANQALLPISAALTGIGLVYLYRLDAVPAGSTSSGQFVFSHHLTSQTGAVILGTICLLTLASVRDIRALSRYKYLCMAGGIGLLLATALFGDWQHGKALKISLGSFEFQPTELVKLLLVIFMAAYLAERSRLLSQRLGRWVISAEDIRYLGPLFAIWVLSLSLLFGQKDLGAALLFFGIFLGMIYISNARRLYFVIGWILFGAGAAYAYEFSVRTRQRIEIWLDPWTYAANEAYQIVRGLYALAFGGLWGTGWGHGAPGLIPAVQTDYVFLGLAEEIGLVGALGVLALYLALIWHGFGIAMRARTTFASMLAAGLTIVLTIQLLVIIGGCLRLIPLTGIPVPFLSRGGTNMVCNLALIGMLLAVSADEPRRKESNGPIP